MAFYVAGAMEIFTNAADECSENKIAEFEYEVG